jgi:hypothetical protein
LCVLAFALVAVVALPSSASALGINSFTYKNTNPLTNTTDAVATQAGGHPNVSISFNRTGSETEDLKDVQLDLPTGVFPNPEAGTKCVSSGTGSANQFQSDTCPNTSRVGSIQVKVKALSLLDLTIDGTINVLQPDPGQVATLGLSLRPKSICILFVFCAQPNKMFLKTGIVVRTYEDGGIRTYTPATPRTAVIGIPLVFATPTITGDITINSMALNFQSNYGVPAASNKPATGGYFWRQTGSCLTQAGTGHGVNTAQSTVKIVDYNNNSASAASAFTPTGCKTPTTASKMVTFDPTFQVAPTNRSAGASTPLKFTLNQSDNDSTLVSGVQNKISTVLPKLVDVSLPAGSGLDLSALSGVTACTEDQLKAQACPASSVIGNADATSRYLPNPSNPAQPGLVGNVYAMGVGNQIPIGVQIIGPRNTVVIFRGTLGTRGDANAGTGAVYATFDKIPQLPYSQFNLTITKPVYKNPVPIGCSEGALQTTTSTITGFDGSDSTNGAGTVKTPSATYPITNCPATPNTTITSGPSTTVPTSNTNPPFAFTSTVPGSTFQCAMTNTKAATPIPADAAFSPCTSPYTPATALSAGGHTFFVRAVNGGLVDPTPASLMFDVSTSSTFAAQITPSTTQARAHPDVAANFDISGGAPKGIALTLPEGFDASLSAVTPCDAAVAAAGNCTAASQVGTAQVTVSTAAIPSETAVGTLYLTSGPTGADAGGVSAKIQLSFGTLIAQAGAYVTNNGKTQTIEFRSIPQVVGGNDITITNLKTNFSGANSFITNPSSCAASSGFAASATFYSGATAPAFNVPFTATGCSTVSFAPTLTQTLTNPTASQETGVTAALNLGTDNSGIKTLRVNEPTSVGPNYPAFGAQADQCPASAAPTATAIFDPSACPAQALVGSMTINTPLLPTPLTGSVYLINKSPLPWLGVKFDQPGISVRLTGVTSVPQVDPLCDPTTSDTGTCPTQISILFNNLPDVPVNSISLNLNGPSRTGVGGVTLSGKILVVATPADPACQANSVAKSTFTPFSATPNVVLNQTIPIAGCNQ